MDHDFSTHNLNAIRTLRASQNEDVNATAIDEMLIHLKTLLKKYLTIKKIFKELHENTIEMDEQLVNSKIIAINDETKNMPLVYNKNIPPDKRMTNLFYMRILKEVSYYDKIVPNFIQIISRIQEIYNEQVRQNTFSILALYLVCQKRFIQEIKMNSLKVLHILDEKRMKFVVEKIHLEQSFFDKTSNSFQETSLSFELYSYERVTISDFNRNIIAAILDIFVEKKISQNKIVSSFNEVIQKKSGSIMPEEYKDIVTPVFQDIYGPLDLACIEIVPLFIPTLRPDDNIELIYRKVSCRNKKSRKQIKQFLVGFSHYLHRKQEHLKRKIRKTEIRHHKIQSSLLQLPKNILKQQKSKLKNQQSRKTLQETKKYSLKNIELLKPIKQNQKQRSISRFRQQKIQESLQNSKSISTTISHFRSNNLTPIISSQTQGNLEMKLKRKRTSQISSKQKKQKQNDSDNSAKLLKKEKRSKEKKFDIKNVKNGQKRGRSLKMKNPSNKQFANKKLRL